MKKSFSKNVFETWVWKENGKKMKEEIRKMEVIVRKEEEYRSKKLLTRREKRKNKRNLNFIKKKWKLKMFYRKKIKRKIKK